MKISIIMPVYNVEHYLREAIESVLAQTDVEMEILLVDDGSTDGSGAICDEYSERYDNVVIFHQTNQGVSVARNTALSNAHGEYITFIDSDDYLSPDTYGPNIAWLDEHEGVDALQYPTEGEINNRDTEGQIIEGEKELLRHWWAGSPITFSLWNKIFRREVFQGIRFLEGHVSEDTILVATLYKRIRSLYLSTMGLYHYRRRKGSYTDHYDFNKHIDMFNAHLAIYKQLMDYPSLLSEKVIAFTRLYRRLITAKYENPQENIRNFQNEINRIFPTWIEILKSKRTEKGWLSIAKLLGCRLFMDVFIRYLSSKQN